MNEVELDEMIQSSKSLIIKIEASWSVSSRNLEINIMRIYPLFQNKVNLIRIDMDKSKYIVNKFGICVIPTMIFVKDGLIKKLVPGVITPERLKELIEDIL